ARPSEERDPFAQLRRLRPVLQEEDLRLWMPRAEDRHSVRPGGLGDLVAELVDLGDRLLQIPLGDVVRGHGHGGCRRYFGSARSCPTGPRPSRVARAPAPPPSSSAGRRATSGGGRSPPCGERGAPPP